MKTEQVPRLRKTASQIRLMNGELTEENDRIIRIGVLHNREVWKRVAGTGNGTLYELQGED